MNVLFATTGAYLPQCLGGSEWSTHYLCLGLLAAGDNVGLICHLHNSGWLAVTNRIKRRITGKKFPIDHRMGYPVFRGWGPRNGVYDAAKSINADAIVIVGTAPDPCELAREARRTGLPVFYQIRDIEFSKHGNGLGNLDGVKYIANSAFTSDVFFREFGIRPDVVLPPVQRSHCQVPKPGNKVLLINPAPMKGGELALALAERRPNIPFVFQESWSGNSLLFDLKKRAIAAGNIEWRRPTFDIREAYSEARILLAPSQLQEAWGRVATEAHFSGIPVIASDCGGLSQAVGPGGILLSPDAPISDWLAALDRMWNDESEWRRLSQRALEYSTREEIDPNYQTTTFRKIIQDSIARY